MRADDNDKGFGPVELALRCCSFLFLLLMFLSTFSCDGENPNQREGPSMENKPKGELPMPRPADRLSTCENLLVADVGGGFTYEVRLSTSDRVANLGLWAWSWNDMNEAPIRISTGEPIPFAHPASEAWISGCRALESFPGTDNTYPIVLRGKRGEETLQVTRLGPDFECSMMRANASGRNVGIVLEENSDFTKRFGSQERERRLGLFEAQSKRLSWMATIPRKGGPGGGFDLYAAAVSEDGEFVAASGCDNSGSTRVTGAWIGLASAKAKALAWELAIHDATSFIGLAFSPDGSLLYVADSEGHVYVFDVATGRIVRDWKVGGARTTSIAISPDGKLLAVGTGAVGTVFLFEANTGKCLLTLDTGDHTVYGLAFSPDSAFLATNGTTGNRIRIWKMPR